MEYALPSGVVNTDSAYFYADATLDLGVLVKDIGDQTLVVVDYSNVSPAIAVSRWTFAVDISSNPALVVSYPQSNSTGTVLTFLLSGGIAGQQYNIQVEIVTLGGSPRVDTLTVNIPSAEGDCCPQINPVPEIYSQLPLGTQAYVNTGVRYFWGTAAPVNPGVLDQWYNTTTRVLSEWVTDGTTYFWQPVDSAGISDAPSTGLIYGRDNGVWVANPIQLDAPSTGLIYGRDNGVWVADPIQLDAPSTGLIYGRYNGAWAVDPIQLDAPSDGNMYARKNADWVIVTSGGGGTVDPIAPVGGGIINADQIAVTTADTLICAARAGSRVNITIQNNGYSVVALGNAGLTFAASSWRLAIGEAVTILTTAAIHGICDTGGSSVVDFIEVIATGGVAPIGGASIAAGQVPISNAATVVCAARVGAAGIGRVNITIQNNGTEIVALGDAGLTFASASWRLGAGGAITLPTTAEIFGITASAGSVVDFLEVY